MAKSLPWMMRTAIFTVVGGLAAYLFVIRPWHLHWGATSEELAREFPGDGLVEGAWLRATRAITVAAPPRAVWPWLLQMGYHRAGWYSYDRFDNGGVVANRVIPELQHLKVGDILLTGRDFGFAVHALAPNHHLVLLIDRDDAHISSTICLDALEGERTRLVVRLHARFRLAPRSLFFAAAFDFGDFVMMRKMLLGIKQRAEKEYRKSLHKLEMM